MEKAIQKLELVDDRFPAIFTGEKTNTLRWREGDIKPGYLVFYASNNPKWKTLVWVTNVDTTPMDKIAHVYDVTPEELHKAMLRHYPDIQIDSEVVFVEHLTPQQTMEQYGLPEQLGFEPIMDLDALNECSAMTET